MKIRKHYLPEREWFIKKFEEAVGKNISKSKIPFATLEKDIRCRKICKRERHLFYEYKERPRPDDIPDIIWDGPPLNTCFCISPYDNCDCSTVLPPRRLSIGNYPKKIMHWLQNLPRKVRIYNIGTVPKRPFEVKRLQEHLKAEAEVQNQLKKMNIKGGPKFCIYKCYYYNNPPADEIDMYFQIKKQLYKTYKKKSVKKPLSVANIAVTHIAVANIAVANIADEMIDGLYRSVSTQATTDENGEFVMGDVSHILFGNSTVYQDIEGTPYYVRTYEEIVTKEPDPLVKKLENLLSISRIKNRVSKLTSSLMSSIVEIEDTGIPINTRGTQDPSLDKYFESIKVPSKFTVDKVTKEEVCPCCKYKELQTIENDQDENYSIDNYDDFVSKGAESLFYTPFERRRLRISDNDIVEKQTLPVKYNFPSEARKNDENQSKLKNINDNIELLKQDLMINKQVKKYNTLSKLMLNVEGNKTEQNTGKHAHGLFKGIDKKNNQMNSLEFLESIKPCCIDILCKQLEIKISIENYFKKLLANEVFRRVYRRIYKIKEKRQNNNNNNNINTKMDSADLHVKKKQIKFLKFGTNVNKFLNLNKNQKSSFKVFDKENEEAHIKLKSRKTLSFQGFKVKIKTSLKKMNNAVSSFLKRYCTKSSNNIKQLNSFLKKNTDGVIGNVSKAADHSSDDTEPNMTDMRDSKTSEKEVFMVQYSSTCEL